MEKEKQAKRYTAKERKAYYMGLGAGVGFGKIQNIKKTVNKMSEAEKRSFYNGFDDYLQKKIRIGEKNSKKKMEGSR